MKKILVNNEKEYVAIFKDLGWEEAEGFLSVSFANTAGQYWDDPDLDCNLPMDHNIYKKNEDSNFPEKYPCLILFDNTETFDRLGIVKFEMLEFIYLSDFK